MHIRNLITHRALSFIIRIFLGITFVYASWDKILHPEAFAQAIANYRILPSFLVGIMAVAMPWIELFCGLFLILGLFVRSSALILSLMFVMFSIALSSTVIRGIDIDCGCFSVTKSEHAVNLNLIFRDLGYLVLSLHVLFWDKGFLSLSPIFKRSSQRV